jgi:hypothetical protein
MVTTQPTVWLTGAIQTISVALSVPESMVRATDIAHQHNLILALRNTTVVPIAT